MDEIKTKYNELLKRYYKAEKWIDSPERKIDEIERYKEPFLNIVIQLSSILNQMEKENIAYTDNEILHGFK